MDKRIELLEERTVIFLEKTKKQREKYKTERKTLFDFSEERNNLDAWEEYLNKIISDNGILNSNMKCVKVNAGFTNTVYILDDKYIIKICSDRGNK